MTFPLRQGDAALRTISLGTTMGLVNAEHVQASIPLHPQKPS